MKLADSTGIGIKKARQLKTAAESYLVEEQKLREELSGESKETIEMISPPARSGTPEQSAGPS
jgi:N utilization substance protein A